MTKRKDCLNRRASLRFFTRPYPLRTQANRNPEVSVGIGTRTAVEILIPAMGLGAADDLAKHVSSDLSASVPVEVKYQPNAREINAELRRRQAELRRRFEAAVLKFKLDFSEEARRQLAPLVDEAITVLRREIEATDDPDLEKSLRQLASDLLQSVEPLSPEITVEGENLEWLLPQRWVAFCLIDPLKQLEHAILVFDVFLKSPIPATVLTVTTTKIVGSLASWLRKKRKSKEKAEVRLYGPDGKLIDKRTIE